ncbi:phosphoglycolate phosphatase-like protein [Thermochaetoides thermophila DSM 1495]|uniref:Phosphoglycolate phosphatase-like protein n=1 Tax=Chaetomium thermophilum (strain DSM 1495 / CBS 144.50 / IMI 039719) TaxID=759272 RepID=G0SDA5_CHATD|nr:phosphoglycolate phosphatase-like protein [Thermochaetoides thermophila DSM 1495]EGS18506.1 phosphoglycolate phosphatase-like protein [Thermochaetoides thermophila DSM 1495]
MSPSASWKFAPLGKPYVPSPNIRKLEGVVFDVDGTLCLPQNYMFAEMRAALGIPKSVDILEHIYSLPTPEAQTTAMEKIRSIERRAMEHQKPQPGLVELMAYLSSKNIRKGICTRNFDTPVHNLLTKFLAGHEFAPIVTRDFRPPKPDPAGILHIARSWGLVRRSTGEAGVPADETREKERVKRGDVEKTNGDGLLAKTEEGEEVADASQLIMVGDSIDDMTAGRRAGAKTVLLVNDVNRDLINHEYTDMAINRLDELIDILENGRL